MEIDLKKEISKKLRQLRFDNDMTQSDLAEQSTVDVSTIVRYERNNVTMQLDTIAKMINPYGMTLNIFFEEILAKTHDNSTEQEV